MAKASLHETSCADRFVYEFGPYELDVARRLLLRGTERIKLTAKSFNLLLELVGAEGRLLPNDQIHRALWRDRLVEPGNLTVQLSKLRTALGDDAAEPKYVETVRGEGYRFIARVTKRAASPAQAAAATGAADLQGGEPIEPARQMAETELCRRQSIVFEQQVQILRRALSLTYRVRNAARELNDLIRQHDSAALPAAILSEKSEQVRAIYCHFMAIREMLYEERALIPPSAFSLLHSVKRELTDIFTSLSAAQRLSAENEQKVEEHWPTLRDMIREDYEELNQVYGRLVSTIHGHLGVSSGSAARATEHRSSS